MSPAVLATQARMARDRGRIGRARLVLAIFASEPAQAAAQAAALAKEAEGARFSDWAGRFARLAADNAKSGFRVERDAAGNLSAELADIDEEYAAVSEARDEQLSLMQRVVISTAGDAVVSAGSAARGFVGAELPKATSGRDEKIMSEGAAAGAAVRSTLTKYLVPVALAFAAVVGGLFYLRRTA